MDEFTVDGMRACLHSDITITPPAYAAFVRPIALEAEESPHHERTPTLSEEDEEEEAEIYCRRADISEDFGWTPQTSSPSSDDAEGATSTTSATTVNETDKALLALRQLQTIADGYAAAVPPAKQPVANTVFVPIAPVQRPPAIWQPLVVTWSQFESPYGGNGRTPAETTPRLRRLCRALSAVERRAPWVCFVWVDERVWMGLFSATVLSILLVSMS